MSMDDVLESCQAAGIDLHLVNGALRVSHASRLTEELRAGLKQHKGQIVLDMSLSILDLVFLVFPDAQEIDHKGKPVKRKGAPGGLFSVAEDTNQFAETALLR